MSNDYSIYKPKTPKKPIGEFATPPQTYPENMPSSFSKGQAKLHFEKDLVFEYKNYHGETVFWVKRDDATRSSKKKFTPFSYIGKKNSDGKVKWVLLKSIGVSKVVQNVSDEIIMKSIKKVLN